MKKYKNILEALGINLMPTDEQAVFLLEIGDTVTNAALLRLVADLNDSQTEALEYYLETEPDSETLLNHLTTTYPIFEKFFNEEASSFRVEAEAVLGIATQ